MVTVDDVLTIYRHADTPLSNERLYRRLEKKTGQSLNDMMPVGVAKAYHSKSKRQVRWYQQTLKQLGVLEKVEGERGIWALTDKAKGELHPAKDNIKMVAYSTQLGCAIWAKSQAVFGELNEEIHLCVTSPPYPLKSQRQYGNVAESKWVDFITESIEPIVKNLADGGSIVLNVSNDIFESKKPSRSLYVERMVLALNDRLGLSLMDRWPWINLSKPPGPTYWACVNRVQLCSGWEPIFWFTNNPDTVRSNNNRVLVPHSDEHKKLMAKGGDGRERQYGDGAYTLRKKSFSKVTDGKIPKNVIQRGHQCADSLAARQHAKALGLPIHSAMFPTSIPEFAIDFLTKEDDLVVDLFSGMNKVGLAAERKGRRWLSTEIMLEYIRVQAELFKGASGFKMNPALACL